MKYFYLLFTGLLSVLSFSQTINIQPFATGFSSPVAIEHAGDSRLFVVERGGNIKIVDSNGTVNTTPFLTLSSIITSGGERGLLGLAFHPNYAENGYFYVNYTRSGDGATTIARYSVNAENPNVANASSGTVLLVMSQPYTNHNGGSLAFGSDGYLYIGMGDGGSGGDPNNYAQNNNTLLGKKLRIDVDNGSPYSIPADNPFANGGGSPEIWATGLRNPWKFSFNRNTGDLWIADVGQNAREEINKITFPLTPGLNFGWRCYEGNSPYNTNGCGSASNYTFPISTYQLTGGYCAVTGGYEYVGTMYPNFNNKYIFADYCANRIGWIDSAGGTITWTSPFTGNFSTLGQDVSGELYIAGISSGVVSKIIDTDLSAGDFSENGFTLYPNPASGEFFIKNQNLNPISEISVTDISGKIIWFQNTQTEESYRISTQNWQQGFYIVSVKDANGKISNTKLMVK